MNETLDQEPDYRFTLANERTFLAWIRTALGLVAGGIAAHQLLLDMPLMRIGLTGCCLTMALVLSIGAFFHWRAAQQSMRRNGALPGNTLIPLLTVGISLTIMLAAAGALLV